MLAGRRSVCANFVPWLLVLFLESFFWPPPPPPRPEICCTLCTSAEPTGGQWAVMNSSGGYYENYRPCYEWQDASLWTETFWLPKQSFYCRPWRTNSFELVQWILSNTTVMTDRNCPTKISLGFCPWFPMTEWVVFIWLPLPPLLSPWLVKIARARKVMVRGTFAFLYLKPNTVRMFCCHLSKWIDVIPDDCRSFSTYLKFTKEKCRQPWREGGCGESWAKTRVVFPDWKIRRLKLVETPVSGDHKVQCMECHSSSPYFWLVRCVFWNSRVHVTVATTGVLLARQTDCCWRLDNNWHSVWFVDGFRRTSSPVYSEW